MFFLPCFQTLLDDGCSSVLLSKLIMMLGEGLEKALRLERSSLQTGHRELGRRDALNLGLLELGDLTNRELVGSLLLFGRERLALVGNRS